MQTAPSAMVELDAAILQVAVTLGVGLYSLLLYRRYRKPYFMWLSVAWLLYVARLFAIIAFLVTNASIWLYWHQVATGWTALALLWAALVFSRQLRFRLPYLVALLFPVGWSFVAIYVLERFLYAALPAVLFLSAVTAWTGWLFFDYARRVRSPGAGLLAAALTLWALHHLDYPFLRARGAWTPWGYYLDIAFVLLTAAGITVLVLDDLRRGLQALSTLSATSSADGQRDIVDELLARALTLPAARGAVLYRCDAPDVRFVRGVGAGAAWEGEPLTAKAGACVVRAVEQRRPIVLPDWSAPDGRRYAFTAILPIPGEITPPQALVVAGDARDPFAALDDTFLVALGRQLASALDSAELTRRLRERTDELTRLSTRMVHHHADERRRLSRELHDETAQVFSALKLQLGLLQERADSAAAQDLTGALLLVDEGMRSIRSVTETLRPAVLDALGLVPALRSITDEFASRAPMRVQASLPPIPASLNPEAELAVYRALQESLSNVLRHAGATEVRIALARLPGAITLRVEDDGVGLSPGASLDLFERDGRMGLAGMRDRVASLGGTVSLVRAERGGTRVVITLPLEEEDA